jgi:hypothetical protein
MATLHEIGLKYNTDKAYAHGFCNDYEIFLKDMDISSIVEVGILDGASLRMWAEFYPSAKIIGIDIDRKTLINVDNIFSYLGDQANPLGTILPHVMETNCDLFIDDGSHQWSHQINTFNNIFPFMKVGSVYILEDLHTSLWTDRGYNDCKINPSEYIKNFVENNTNVSYKFVDNNDHQSLSMIIKKLSF